MTIPIRVRLALVCAALVTTLLALVGLVVYTRMEADLLQAVDDELRSRATTHLEEGPDAELTVATTDVGDIFAQRQARDGRVLATTPGLIGAVPLPGVALASLAAPSVVEAVVATVDESVLVRVLAMPAPDSSIIVVGVTIDDQRAALATLQLELVLALPIAIVLAGGVGWLVAAAALRPVERMRLEAEAVSGLEPDRRLSVPPTRDELAALGSSLNRMLDRLEATVERERRFVDDASHELRSPLANLKAELDLALRRPRTDAESTAALRSAAVETDRLTRLAEDLLVLARADGRRVPTAREAVEVGSLCASVAGSFAGRAQERDVALEVPGPTGPTAHADPVRLRQAIGNLLDNALRHTPPGGRIELSVERDGAWVVLAVADTGEGFPPAFLARAFEPFSRADVARSRQDGGAGLGLAIVAAIAESHGGRVEAANRPGGGAVVRLRLPG